MAVARAGTTTLVGTVVGPRLDAVAGARVVVSAGGPSAAATTTSGEDGAFRVADLMVGLAADRRSGIGGDRRREAPRQLATGCTHGGRRDLGWRDPARADRRAVPGSEDSHRVFRSGVGARTASIATVSRTWPSSTRTPLKVWRSSSVRATAASRFASGCAVGGFSIAAGDLTVDGVDDLVVGSGSRAIVLRGAGDGTFDDHARPGAGYRRRVTADRRLRLRWARRCLVQRQAEQEPGARPRQRRRLAAHADAVRGARIARGSRDRRLRPRRAARRRGRADHECGAPCRRDSARRRRRRADGLGPAVVLVAAAAAGRGRLRRRRPARSRHRRRPRLRRQCVHRPRKR